MFVRRAGPDVILLESYPLESLCWEKTHNFVPSATEHADLEQSRTVSMVFPQVESEGLHVMVLTLFVFNGRLSSKT